MPSSGSLDTKSYVRVQEELVVQGPLRPLSPCQFEDNKSLNTQREENQNYRYV